MHIRTPRSTTAGVGRLRVCGDLVGVAGEPVECVLERPDVFHEPRDAPGYERAERSMARRAGRGSRRRRLGCRRPSCVALLQRAKPDRPVLVANAVGDVGGVFDEAESGVPGGRVVACRHEGVGARRGSSGSARPAWSSVAVVATTARRLIAVSRGESLASSPRWRGRRSDLAGRVGTGRATRMPWCPW
jgi:hypothetical protein